MARPLVSLLALTLLAGCRPPGAAGPSADPRARAVLARELDSIADAPAFRNGHWGILVVDPALGDTLYSRNAGKLFMPASNQKILTSAVALAQLGPDYTYRTSLVAGGPVRDGLLAGHLLVVGRGDPAMSDRMRGDAMTPLRAAAESLWQRGVRRIAGDVVAHGDAFPDDVLGYGWTYADLDAGYSAPTDELLFNEGVSRVVVRGASSAGAPATAATLPARSWPRLQVDVRTVPRPAAGDSAALRAIGIRVRKDTLAGTVRVTGTIAAGDSATETVTHRDPGEAWIAAMREALRDRGIVIDSGWVTGAAPGDTLASITSPPMREILAALMKPSQNQIAEMVFKTIALERGAWGTAAEARRLVEEQLVAWGAPVNGFVVRDGSGLSRYDYLSPETVLLALDAMRRSPHFAVYLDAMPVGGVDGTIRNRMRGTPAEGNVRAKTGSVAQSRSLSGYVRSADGRLLLFSTLANNWTVPARDVERAADSIVVRLARYRGR